jgi:hypothetical protein
MTTELSNHEAFKMVQKLRYKKEPIPNDILEKSKAYLRERHALKTEEEKQAHKDRCKNNYLNNHEEHLQNAANMRETEEYKIKMAEYRQSEAGKKSARISCWKQWGVINDDYEALYTKWKTTTHCEECNVELAEGNKVKNKKVLDHDHKTGLFRNILCNSCNTKRGNADRGIVRKSNEQYNKNRRIKYANAKLNKDP